MPRYAELSRRVPKTNGANVHDFQMIREERAARLYINKQSNCSFC